jgi:Uncharacterized protein conserved in bacteria (DUF2188)
LGDKARPNLGRPCLPEPLPTLIRNQMEFFYVFPAHEDQWLVAREGETARVFRSKELAYEYARQTAAGRRPSIVVELTAAGHELSREAFG